MSENKLETIPKLKIKTITTTENGSIMQQLLLPNGNVIQTINPTYEDGIYYSIYEICELIDNHIMKTHVIAYDKETNKRYKLTEEIQKLLESVPKNLYFSIKQLPGKNGYYIHEKALQEMLQRLEKKYDVEEIIKDMFFKKGRTKEQERSEKVRKIAQAQEQYLRETTKQQKFSNVKFKNNNSIKKTTAILLTIAAVTLALTTGPKQGYAQEPTYQVQVQEVVEIGNPDINNVTITDLCQNIKLGENYKVNSTKIYESSDHTGRSGTVSENYYGIKIISIVDKNDNIHIIDEKSLETSNQATLISQTQVENAKYVSAAISAPDGTILGWIDITKENLPKLSEKIAKEKNKIVQTYTIMTSNPENIIHPETGKVFEIISGNLYDQKGNKEENIIITSITNSNGESINLENHAQGRGR